MRNRFLFGAIAVAVAASVSAQDVPWTQTYNWAQSPEGNSFTRTYYGSPVVNEVTGGPPSGRKVEIDSTNGSAVFLTSQVPTLDPTVGTTTEMRVAVTGAGDAGCEMTFLSRVVSLQVFANSVNLYAPQNVGDGVNITVPTASNGAATLFRFTFDPNSQARVYREGVLVIGPVTIGAVTQPFQRVLWYGEGGGTQTFNVLRYYSGGAVAP